MSDANLFISEVLKGMTQGMMQGMEMKRKRYEFDETLKLKREELDLKKQAKQGKPADLSFNEYYELAKRENPDAQMGAKLYQDYVRATKGKGDDFYSILNSIGPSLSNVPPEKMSETLEQIYQTASALKGKPTLSPEERAEEEALEKKKITLELDEKSVTIDQKRQELLEMIKTFPEREKELKGKINKLDAEEDRLRTQARLNEANRIKTLREAEAKKTGDIGARTITGFGSEIVSDKRTTQKLSESFTSARSTARIIDEIGEISNKFRVVRSGDSSFGGFVRGIKKRLTPERFDKEKKQIGALISRIKAKIRIDVTGGGNVSDNEQILLDSIAANPSKFFQDVDASMSALKALKGHMAMEAAEKGMAQGVKFPISYFKDAGVDMTSKEGRKRWGRYKKAYETQILSDREFLNRYPNTATAKNMGASMVAEKIAEKQVKGGSVKPPSAYDAYPIKIKGIIDQLSERFGVSREETIKRLRKAGRI
jgi:hypothetical protein